MTASSSATMERIFSASIFRTLCKLWNERRLGPYCALLPSEASAADLGGYDRTGSCLQQPDRLSGSGVAASLWGRASSAASGREEFRGGRPVVVLGQKQASNGNPLALLELARRSESVVLIGAPGMGKSTALAEIGAHLQTRVRRVRTFVHPHLRQKLHPNWCYSTPWMRRCRLASSILLPASPLISRQWAAPVFGSLAARLTG